MHLVQEVGVRVRGMCTGTGTGVGVGAGLGRHAHLVEEVGVAVVQTHVEGLVKDALHEGAEVLLLLGLGLGLGLG